MVAYSNSASGRMKYLIFNALCVLHLGTLAYSSWAPEMVGGLKLIIDGDSYSFNTDVCSGGVFFKRPEYVRLTCSHGYFLRRKNGCLMDESDIIGGSDYACEDVNKDDLELVQAFIPVTNPESPLEHTVTLYDDMDGLTNLRRYTYVKALEGKYAAKDSSPAGAIVTNPHTTPSTSIGNLCYGGKAQNKGNSYLMSLPPTGSQGSDFFSQRCSRDSVDFPFSEAKVFGFNGGYSNPEFFKDEVNAVLPEALKSEDSEDLSKFEIWGGKAYCLQARIKESTEGKLDMAGLRPSISSLQSHCLNVSFKKSITNLVKTLSRRKREEGGAEAKKAKYSDLTGCLASCWGPGEAACRRSMGRGGGGGGRFGR